MRRLQMVPLVCELSLFEAQLLAARLGAEGMVWELRGASIVYPVGWVDVLVENDDLGPARELLLTDEIESAFDDEWEDGPASERSRWSGVVFGGALVALAGGFLLVRILALG